MISHCLPNADNIFKCAYLNSFLSLSLNLESQSVLFPLSSPLPPTFAPKIVRLTPADVTWFFTEKVCSFLLLLGRRSQYLLHSLPERRFFLGEREEDWCISYSSLPSIIWNVCCRRQRNAKSLEKHWHEKVSSCGKGGEQADFFYLFSRDSYLSVPKETH